MRDDLATQLRIDAEAYRQSLASPDTDDMFSLAYQWQDKKHRHVYDLCSRLETAADRIEALETSLGHCIRAIAEWQRKPEGVDPYLLGALDHARKTLEPQP